MNKEKEKILKRQKRRNKIRSVLEGTSKCPRLSVFRSNKGHYIQLIDDANGVTIASAYSNEIKVTSKGDSDSKKEKKKVGAKVSEAFELGKLIAKKAHDKKITKVVFDRGGYRYHGRIKAIADGAREGGLKF